MARPKVDPNETPDARFRRLTKTRMDAALVALARVGNLAGEKGSKPEYREKILTTLRGEIDKIERRFDNPSESKGPGFTL